MAKKRVYGSIVTLEFLMEVDTPKEEQDYYNNLLENCYNLLVYYTNLLDRCHDLSVAFGNEINFENELHSLAYIINRYIANMIDKEYRDKVVSIQKIYDEDTESYEYVLVIFDIDHEYNKTYIVKVDDELNQFYIEIDEDDE